MLTLRLSDVGSLPGGCLGLVLPWDYNQKIGDLETLYLTMIIP